MSTPNPFDQFDGGAAAPNPFDQFDATQAAVPHTDYGSPAGSFLQNALAGVGKTYAGATLGAQQIWAQLTGGDPNAVESAITGDTAKEERAVDAPLQSTWGGKIGEVGAALPLGFLGGASLAGAAAVGAGLGAAQPTVGNESRILNTALGGAIGAGTSYAGGAVGNWITQRGAQPFMGWSQASGNRAAASYLGSDAANLDQGALADVDARLSGVFQQARSPNNFAPLTGQTAGAVNQAARGLNRSSLDAFSGNQDVQDLMSLMRSGTASAQQLGTISSNLGKQAAAEMGSKMGDRSLGRALFDLQDHVDGLVGSTIQDPALAQAYSEALPQYRMYMTLSNRPTILNSASGDVNMTALGKYLQRSDKAGYRLGGNDSDLYNAARYGQANPIGSGNASIFTIARHPIQYLASQAMNTLPGRAATGALSRIGAPVEPAIRYGLPAIGIASEPLSLPWLTQ